MNKDVSEFLKEITKRGWSIVRYTGTGHIMIRWKGGGTNIVPQTPSDRRWLLNQWRDIRRIEAGLTTSSNRQRREENI